MDAGKCNQLGPIQHEKDYEVDKSLDSVIRNPNKCIKCRRCVDVCGQVQTVHNLSMANRGRDIMVVPEMGKPMAESACVRCGHCVDVCPVGAIIVDGKPYKCAVAHNLGQVRKLLEGDYKNYDVVRLMA